MTIPSTPNTSYLFQLGSGIANSTISYYGLMTYLDYQISFNTVFSTKPRIYSHHPILRDNGDIKGEISSYAEKCMFDVFLSIYKQDYVGSDNLHSSIKLVHKICKEISSVMNRRCGHTFMTLDGLYGKFISISAGMPSDTSNWSITLCNSFFNCFPSTLQDQMEDDFFITYHLNKQSTKTLQLSVMRAVRVSLSTSY